MSNKHFDTSETLRQCREKMNGYRAILQGKVTSDGRDASGRFEEVCSDFRRAANWYHANKNSDELIAAILSAKRNLKRLFQNDDTVQGVIDSIEIEVNTRRHFGGPEL